MSHFLKFSSAWIIRTSFRCVNLMRNSRATYIINGLNHPAARAVKFRYSNVVTGTVQSLLTVPWHSQSLEHCSHPRTGVSCNHICSVTVSEWRYWEALYSRIWNAWSLQPLVKSQFVLLVQWQKTGKISASWMKNGLFSQFHWPLIIKIKWVNICFIIKYAIIDYVKN
jgi:hypothetical protein